MSRTTRDFEHDGHTYELYEISPDEAWNLFEDFDDEAALVGSVVRHGAGFAIECYWKPEPLGGIRPTGARTVDEAVTALLVVAAGNDPRGASSVGSEAI